MISSVVRLLNDGQQHRERPSKDEADVLQLAVISHWPCIDHDLQDIRYWANHQADEAAHCKMHRTGDIVTRSYALLTYGKPATVHIQMMLNMYEYIQGSRYRYLVYIHHLDTAVLEEPPIYTHYTLKEQLCMYIPTPLACTPNSMLILISSSLCLHRRCPKHKMQQLINLPRSAVVVIDFEYSICIS